MQVQGSRRCPGHSRSAYEGASGAVNQADIFLLDSGGPGEQAGEITINMIKHC